MRMVEGLAMWFVGQHAAKAERRLIRRKSRKLSPAQRLHVLAEACRPVQAPPA